MKKVTGTYDVFGKQGSELRKLEDDLFYIANLYNYEYIKTPIIEESSLYHRQNSNTVDAVNKHTYDFKDLSGKDITLRPEVNSGIVRAVIENNLYTKLPLKLYYYGDVFRYDKPQKDRYREFTQFGFEIVGIDNAITDAEMLSFAYNIYKRLGINDITMRLNSLGDLNDINNYRIKLIDYFSKYINEMCDDCKKRLINNPLRILNCNNSFDRNIIDNAPKLLGFISKDSRERFEKVLSYLQDNNIPFVVDKDFIRGIDYQNDTIFEIVNEDGSLCTQNNLCGGGRYDNLYQYLSGKKIPAIGFDFGLERMISSIYSQNKSYFSNDCIDIFFVCFTEEDMNYCYKICAILRENNIRVEYDLINRSYKTQLKYGDKYNSKYTCFIGENERKNNVINVRDNTNNTSQLLDISDIINMINEDKKVKVKKYGTK
ncbi:MAG: histidine--tRNA ligase [bacterium]|nr:histidine--tRNA ligase [bacterium]